MTKEVRKAIMIRSKLRNKFLKDKNEQQEMIIGSKHKFIRMTRQQYFSNLDLSSISDNNIIWKTVKQLFSGKISRRDIISLTEDGQTITEDLQIAEIFNNYFSKAIRSFCNWNVPTGPGIACYQNSVPTAINKFKNHSSILSINKNIERIECPSFAFNFVSLEETVKKAKKLRIKKAFWLKPRYQMVKN